MVNQDGVCLYGNSLLNQRQTGRHARDQVGHLRRALDLETVRPVIFKQRRLQPRVGLCEQRAGIDCVSDRVRCHMSERID